MARSIRPSSGRPPRLGRELGAGLVRQLVVEKPSEAFASEPREGAE